MTRATQLCAYVGCYTTPDRQGRGKGINVYRVDPATGDWTLVQVLEGVVNPSFLAVDSARRHLYCVHGGDDFSYASAFAIDPRSGGVSHLNDQQCGGPNPVHLSVNQTDRALVVANYKSGSVAALPILRDGTLGPLSDLHTLSGEPGPHRVEQASSHPHDAVIDPAGRFVAVPDKGLDRIWVFRLDVGEADTQTSDRPPVAALQPGDPAFVRTRRGAGPRHIAFHPRLPYAYVINELDSSVATYAFDAAAGTLRPLQVIPSTPSDFTADNTGAEIVVAPSGRFVYASNRGHDSIGIFGVDTASGLLSPPGWARTQGKHPRNFNLDPSGAFLYVGNADSDTIVSFAVDATTGALTPTGQVIHTGTPVSVVFASA